MHDIRIEAAITLAKQLLEEAEKEFQPDERKQMALINGLIQSQEAKAFCSQVADSCFRSKDPKKIVGQFVSLLDEYKIPHFFSRFQKALLYSVTFIPHFLPQKRFRLFF